MIPMETVLKIIKTDRERKSKFDIPPAALSYAYAQHQRKVSVLPETVTDESFIENTEYLALLWIKQEINKEISVDILDKG